MKYIRSYPVKGTPDCPIALLYNSNCTIPVKTYTHWHPDMEILIVRQGSLTMYADEQLYRLDPGDIMLLEPGTIHGLRQLTPDVKWYQVIIAREAITLPATHIFERSFVAPMFEGRLRMPRLVLSGHPLHPALSQLFTHLPACRMDASNYKNLRFSLAIALCAMLVPYCTTQEEPLQLPENNAVKKAVIYIHNHLTKKLILQDIADYVHLHPNYLCALFKKHMGESIFQHIARRRVAHAASLLSNEELSVARVAEKAGFNSHSVFHKKFKEFTGLSPLAYAKQHRVLPSVGFPEGDEY